MSWEDSKLKEQVFRKIKLNQEVILKMVEVEDGKITLIFSLKNNESITEIPITLEEWKSILVFLNETSADIAQHIEKNQVLPIAKPVAEPVAEAVAEPLTEIEAEPVSDEDFEELTGEMQKVTQISAPDVPVVLSEEVITEVTRKPAREEELSLEESVIEASAESTSQSLAQEEIKTAETSFSSDETTEDTQVEVPTSFFPEDIFEDFGASEDTAVSLLTPPEIPKITQPSKKELESLLTPILKPKISSVEDSEPEPGVLEDIPIEPEIPEESTTTEDSLSSTQVSASELLDETRLIEETKQMESSVEVQQEPVMLNKADQLLSSDEKEAKIVAAMEEVAALMPPGPAKKFVEEMMLKRTANNTLNQPRIPQKFNSDNEDTNN
ncbi:MAG: hypothetical protein HWN66_19960 [Candidatus Helarchaeota archaeon]|nr:hypothetical protein [Candidatus Helarchaeota archaeon]